MAFSVDEVDMTTIDANHDGAMKAPQSPAVAKICGQRRWGQQGLDAILCAHLPVSLRNRSQHEYFSSDISHITPCYTSYWKQYARSSISSNNDTGWISTLMSPVTLRPSKPILLRHADIWLARLKIIFISDILNIASKMHYLDLMV